jgi:hypothetical protein
MMPMMMPIIGTELLLLVPMLVEHRDHRRDHDRHADPASAPVIDERSSCPGRVECDRF